MLNGTLAILATRTTGQSILTNAIIESFTIHARALMHFLYPPERTHPSDVLAEDFFDAGAWVSMRPDEPAAFATARGRVNKEIAHLTYDRQLVTPELKGWDFVSLGSAINEVTEAFLNAMPQRLLGPRWQQHAAEDKIDVSTP